MKTLKAERALGDSEAGVGSAIETAPRASSAAMAAFSVRAWPHGGRAGIVVTHFGAGKIAGIQPPSTKWLTIVHAQCRILNHMD